MKKFLLILPILFLHCGFQNVLAQKGKVWGGIINGRASYLPKPVYPQEAKDLCASGRVEVEVEVAFKTLTGEVVSPKAISGDKLLRKSAEEAAMKARFPAFNDAVISKFYGILVFNFPPENKCIEAGIINKKAISLPKPGLPSNIKATGTIEVRVVIDESGKVIAAKAISGHLLLFAFAENAARQAKFNPTNDVGKIRVKGLLIYKFNADRTVETDFPKDKTKKKQ